MVHLKTRLFLGVRELYNIGILTLLLLSNGCRIERTADHEDTASSPGAESLPGTTRSSLSKALSVEYAHELAPLHPQVMTPDLVAPIESVRGALPLAPPPEEVDDQKQNLTQLGEWLDSNPALIGMHAFVYGGGVPIESLRLPHEVPTSPLMLIVSLTAEMESSRATNAGVGAALRLNGSSEVEALVQDENGRIGRVLGVNNIATPTLLAAALLRAGGATVRGGGADTLADKLGHLKTELRTNEATTLYKRDLTAFFRAQQNTGQLSLFHLLVDPQTAAHAMADTTELPPAPPRNPIFVVAITAEQHVIFAASHGGVPLALPGAPSLLEGDAVFGTANDRFVMLLPSETCSTNALALAQSSASEAHIQSQIIANCPDSKFAIVTPRVFLTNLPVDSFVSANYESKPKTTELAVETEKSVTKPLSHSQPQPKETSTDQAASTAHNNEAAAVTDHSTPKINSQLTTPSTAESKSPEPKSPSAKTIPSTGSPAK